MLKANTKDFSNQLNLFFEQQLQNWDIASKNFHNLNELNIRKIKFKNSYLILQNNPHRITSTTANIDKLSIQSRKCFLCLANLPKNQKILNFDKKFNILVNPYPIFNKHFTIVHHNHVPQQIEDHFSKMLTLAKYLKDYILFYNGPKCGASAPDHMHFQAISSRNLPIKDLIYNISETTENLILSRDDFNVWFLDSFLTNTIVLTGYNMLKLEKIFNKILFFLKKNETSEPLINILCFYNKNKWHIALFPRSKHRPWQFFSEGKSKILLSPASIDLGGVLILPRKEDFDKLKRLDIKNIFQQIGIEDSYFDEIISYIKKQ